MIFTARCYASAVLAMGLCLSVRLSVRHKSVFFWHVSFLHPSYTALKGNSVVSKNKGTFLWNYVLKSGLRKYRHGISILETCYRLSSRKVDAHSVINWAVIGQLSRYYLRASTLDHYSLSLRSSSAVHSTLLSHGSISGR